jgi:hypothetical protein
MMPIRRVPSLFQCVAVGALVLVVASCTPGGQFDPTTFLNSDMFESKKKIDGTREPVFPNGVPGTTTGVPPDLVKGYQPPTDQNATTDTAAQPPAEKPKPKPKLARAPSQNAQNAVASKKPAQAPPARISIGPKSQPATPAQQGAESSQPASPGSPQAAPAQQTAAPAASSQSVWPNPPTSRTTSQ